MKQHLEGTELFFCKFIDVLRSQDIHVESHVISEEKKITFDKSFQRNVRFYSVVPVNCDHETPQTFQRNQSIDRLWSVQCI
jgi:hypothetical protein